VLAGFVAAGLSLYVRTENLIGRTDRLNEEIAEIRDTAQHAAQRLDRQELEGLRQRRPAGPRLRRSWHREITTSDFQATIPVGDDERPIHGGVTIRNRADSVLRDVALSVDGHSYFRTTGAMIARAVPEGATDDEKAFALYNFVKRHRYHWFPPEETLVNAGAEMHCPVRFLGVYGYGWCDDAAINLALLWRAAGLESRVWMLNGHVVPEVRYDASWHVMDPDAETFYVKPSSGELASVKQLEQAPVLVLRSRMGLAHYEARRRSMAEYYRTTDNYAVPLPPDRKHNLQLNLLPGEDILYPWRNWDRDIAALAAPLQPADVSVPGHDASDAGFHASEFFNAPPFFGKASLTWRLPLNAFGDMESLSRGLTSDLSQATAQHLAIATHNGQRVLRNTPARTQGVFSISRRLPFVITGGRLTLHFQPGSPADTVTVRVRRRPDAVESPQLALDRTVTGLDKAETIYIDLTRPFRADNPYATYEYGMEIALRCSGDGGVAGLRIDVHTQTTPFSPYRLKPGNTPVALRTASAAPNAELEYEWYDDRGLQRIFEAPKPAAEPSIEEGKLRLAWSAPRTGDGLPPAWYQVTVSDRRDFLRPVTPAFDTLLSGAYTTWQAPEGFLSAGSTYYWRVRAKDGHGFSTPWSEAASFKYAP